MLSQDNVLRIIAELTSEQIEATNIQGVFLDADPHGDGIARFYCQIVKCDFRDLDAIHKTTLVCHSPYL